MASDENPAASENWIISIHERITGHSWRLECRSGRWELYPSTSFTDRFGLVSDYRLGSYRSIHEAAAAFDAAMSLLWLCDLRAETAAIRRAYAAVSSIPADQENDNGNRNVREDGASQ